MFILWHGPSFLILLAMRNVSEVLIIWHISAGLIYFLDWILMMNETILPRATCHRVMLCFAATSMRTVAQYRRQQSYKAFQPAVVPFVLAPPPPLCSRWPH